MSSYPPLPEPQRLTIDRVAWRDAASVFTVRGDRLHPVVSGNKWFKLKPLLAQCRSDGVRTLVSVGGAFSNHLHALAFAGRQYGFATVGVIRGPERSHWSPTLSDCRRWGMALHFVGRDDYRQRHSEAFAEHWCAPYPAARFIPEGGWSEAAIAGSAEWWRLAGTDLDALVCPVGSGTTLAGLARSAPGDTRVIGVPVYRDPEAYAGLHAKLAGLGLRRDAYELWPGWAGRGFGRLNASERAFLGDFEQRQGIRLDPVYTVKTFRAVADRLKTHPNLRRMKLGVLHTGGLQGLRGVGKSKTMP